MVLSASLYLVSLHVTLTSGFLSGTGRVPDQLVNLDMKHGVEAKNYEEVKTTFLILYRLFIHFSYDISCIVYIYIL